MIALASALALALASPAAPPGCGLPALASGPLPFRPGEALTLDVDVMGMVKAGTVTLTVDRPMSRGQVLPLKAAMQNTSVFAQVRRVRAIAASWVDARSLRPQRYRDEAVEDGVKKSTDTRLDEGGPLLTMRWAYGDQHGTTTAERQRETLDLLSTLYYLRAARLQPGDALCFDLVANRRFWRLQARVAADVDRVETPAGIFDTLRLDAVLVRADGGGQRPLHLWFSRDARRLLVAAVSEIDLGPVRATLARVSGAVPAGPAGSGSGAD